MTIYNDYYSDVNNTILTTTFKKRVGMSGENSKIIIFIFFCLKSNNISTFPALKFSKCDIRSGSIGLHFGGGELCPEDDVPELGADAVPRLLA